MTIFHRFLPGTAALLLSGVLAAQACAGAAEKGAGSRELLWPGPGSVGPQWAYGSPAPSAVSSRGMVATDAPLATRVGSDVLSSGGNAVDAAVAVAFALAVVYPRAGNIGGGGFAIVRTAEGQSAALDFRERAPLAATRDMYLDEQGEMTDRSTTGHLAVGVPGSVAGLWDLHKRYGSMDWNDLLAPAIRLAREGFVADSSFAASVAGDADRLSRFPASAALFLPNGKPVKEGSFWRNPDLAETLRRIAEDGPSGFYQDKTADLIVAEMKAGGGLITYEDLRSYEAKWREPLEFSYRGCQVFSMPPPSSGGLTLALISGILEGYDLAGLGWHSPAALHFTVEAMRRAFAYRNRYLGDPDFVSIPTEMFVSRDYAARQRADISPDHATPSSEISLGQGSDDSEDKNTTHFSVVDGMGNAVALTTTINLSNGSAVTVTGAGFLLNNEMDDFTTKPGAPNAFGLVQSEANAIAPGKRMLSSMTPTIVLRDGEVVLITGASGGPRIITAVFQVISNVVDYDFGISAALSAPRVHHQHLPDRVLYEKDGLTQAQIDALETLGHKLVSTENGIGVAASILRVGSLWAGAPDPRVRGLAAGP
jgi:gamma-glutamyltranspeptidase/glutathione hydrolase